MRGRVAAVLYTRRACPLCFSLGRLAHRSSRRHGVHLIEADVDDDPALLRRYGDRVPVLELPGGTAVSGRAEARDVDDAFARAAVFLGGLEGHRSDVREGGRGLPRRSIAWLLRVLGLGGGGAGDRTI